MNSEQAMANVALAAAQLSIATKYHEKYDDAESAKYLTRVRYKYRVAYLQYTDPFRSKTYA